MPKPTIPPIPDDGTVHTGVRKAINAMRDILNHLVRRSSISRQNTSDRWKINLLDADIPDEITRDTELVAAIDAIRFPVVASFILAVGTNVTTGTDKCTTIVVPFAGTIVKCQAVAKTGPVGADLIFDINLNGTTIWSTQANRIKILDGATTGSQASFNTTAVAAGDQLTIDVDQIGSGTAGKDITVELTMLLENS